MGNQGMEQASLRCSLQILLTRPISVSFLNEKHPKHQQQGSMNYKFCLRMAYVTISSSILKVNEKSAINARLDKPRQPSFLN